MLLLGCFGGLGGRFDLLFDRGGQVDGTPTKREHCECRQGGGGNAEGVLGVITLYGGSGDKEPCRNHACDQRHQCVEVLRLQEADDPQEHADDCESRGDTQDCDEDNGCALPLQKALEGLGEENFQEHGKAVRELGKHEATLPFIWSAFLVLAVCETNRVSVL